eukprot:434124-Alexandrium_andersonii.AAC.1
MLARTTASALRHVLAWRGCLASCGSACAGPCGGLTMGGEGGVSAGGPAVFGSETFQMRAKSV